MSPARDSDEAEGSGMRPVTPVTIAAARLADLAQGLELARVEPRLAAEARAVQALLDGMDTCVASNTTAPSAALADLARRTQEVDWSATHDVTNEAGSSGRPSGLEAEMLSGHVEGQALKMLVQMSGATRVLEVGLFTGYSALAMAEGLPNGGRLVACEIDPQVARFARERLDASPHGATVEIRVGLAADTLRTLAEEGESFDLVFIDADKPGYTGYLDQVLDAGLLAAGGTVLVDNTLLQGEPYACAEPSANGAAIRDFNARVAADDGLEQVVLPLRDGLTVIRRV